MDDPFSVVQEMFSELNCVQWAPWESISAVIAVAGNGGETQEWERALCAMELVFLKILQIAHESFGGRLLSKSFLGGAESPREGSLNSCIIQSVLIPLAALPL